METNVIEDKKIYDDFGSLADNKKKNSITLLLKILLLSVFALSSLLLLFLAPQSLFANRLFINKDIQYFLVFTNPATERINYLVLFRMFFLIGIFIYTIAKNFSNILDNKVNTKKYIPWFVIYLLFSLISVTLLFSFFKNDTMSYYYLSYFSVFVLACDISYSVYTYKLKRKTNPLVYKSKTPTIISITSRIILVLSFLITISVWIFSIKGDKFDFLNNNIVHKTFIDLFNKRDIKNLFLNILLFLFLVLVICGINIERIIIVTSKKHNFADTKEKILLWIVFGFVGLIWFTRAIFYKNSTTIIDTKINSNNYLYLIGLLGIFIAFSFYVTLNFAKKLKLRGSLAKTVTMSFSLVVIWIIASLTALKSSGLLVNNIMTLFAALSTLIIICIYKWNNNSESLYVAIFIKLIAIMVGTTLILNGINSLLLANNNESFYHINSILSLNQIFIITTLSLVFAFSISVLINLMVVLFKLTKKNKTKAISEAK
ncbi:MSC_0624 family F1-like ATPase-associated membrane protein [Mycoplasma enhydrae]|uniref:MSC_0624 family F1-like ATPase-associated membrane protein n=1 Tax=Mycoplasma enhydrae TaxID=2499220 RepID=UPI00197BFCA1|nr:hypothetical protein [Mycoplasma enhydrae]MBN4089661.1 hypothetical protein [Mycoplasma enhydrae]